MTAWTDDDLGALLTDAFRDHEAALLGEQYAEDAARIARGTPAWRPIRRWPALVAAAAAVAVVGGGAAYGVHRLSLGSGGATASSTAGRDSTGAVAPGVGPAHQAAAAAEAQRLIDWVDIAGAQPRATPPASALGQPQSSPAATNQIDATAYWVVPGANATQLQHELAFRSSPVRGASDVMGQSSDNGQVQVLSVSWPGDISGGTAAYDAPTLTVSLFQDGTSVDVRADAFVSWRPARPAASYVSGKVSSVRVSYRRATHGDTHPSGSAVIADPSRIATLTSLVNGLPAVGRHGVYSCPLQLGKPATASMVFTSDAGTWTFRQTLFCVSGVGVTKNGTHVGSLVAGDFSGTVIALLSPRP